MKMFLPMSVGKGKGWRFESNSTSHENYLDGLKKQQYLSTVTPTGRMWHKAFLRWVREQGRSPDSPGDSKNASGPVGIPLKKGASGDRQ